MGISFKSFNPVKIVKKAVKTVVKVVSFNKFKARQFGTLFFWYLFKYK